MKIHFYKIINLILFTWLSSIAFGQNADFTQNTYITSEAYKANPTGYLSTLDNTKFSTGVLIDRIIISKPVSNYSGSGIVNTVDAEIYNSLYFVDFT